MEWSRPTQQGDVPSPRAGHAGVTVGENWFIVGGGDNKSGIDAIGLYCHIIDSFTDCSFWDFMFMNIIIMSPVFIFVIYGNDNVMKKLGSSN